MKKPFVAICVPAGYTCKMLFAFSLAGMTHVTPVRLALIRGDSSRSAAAARNLVLDRLEDIERTYEARFDYLFWVDSDIEFPANALGRLLSYDKDIVGASYVRRSEPHDLLGVPKGPEAQGTGLAEFIRLPAGIMLVKRGVFEKVGRWTVREDPDPQKCLGEDSIFCDRVREAGYEIWCDLDLTREIVHWGDEGFKVKPEESQLVILPGITGQSLRANGHG